MANGANGSGGGASGGGTATQGGSGNSTGTFGSGGSNGRHAAGGGGGWYGGGSSYPAAGGGGSGYVYTSASVINYPTGCLLNGSFYLTNAQTIAGNQSFPAPSGGNETGHSGNGYARITLVE